MVHKGTILIAPAMGSALRLEVLAEEDMTCPCCGQGPKDKGAFYRQLGEKAAKALYDGTPGNFWQAIEDFAVEKALCKGAVKRPVLDSGYSSVGHKHSP